MVGVAQSVEHWVVASEVAGSIPVTHPIEKQKAFENEFFFKGFFDVFEFNQAEPKNRPATTFITGETKWAYLSRLDISSFETSFTPGLPSRMMILGFPPLLDERSL